MNLPELKINIESFSTLIAGISAYVIYLFHKRDEKRKSAIIIESEIRQAIKSINDIEKTRIINDFSSILIDNRWKDYKHYFAKNFSQDELDVISDFFRSCIVIEEQIQFIRKYLQLAMEEKIIIGQQMNLKMYEKYQNNPKGFELEKKEVFDKFLKDRGYAQPDSPKEKVFDYISKVKANINDNHFNSALVKLNKIQIDPWYRLLDKGWEYLGILLIVYMIIWFL